MPSVSLCMIVRNERTDILRCLDSARSVVDEMVVVDTGSVDGTAELCRARGARVFSHAWRGSFAAARNAALGKAKGEWILWLDADEQLCLRSADELRRRLAATRRDWISVPMTHFFGAPPPEATRAHFSSAPRLFRNRRGLRFSGRIHEALDTSGRPTPPDEGPIPSLRILHFGYLDTALGPKAARNRTMLGVEPDGPWLRYHLAAESFRAGEYGHALGLIQTALALSLRAGRLPPALFYKLKYDLLATALPDHPAGAGAEQAATLYPNYVDLQFYRALYHLRRGAWETARAGFSRCLTLGESHPDYLILAGVGSFLALHLLGLCHARLGEDAAAAEAGAQAVRLCPDPGAAAARFLPQTNDKEI